MQITDLPRFIFIVGAPRCGTTTLAAFLKQHPRICYPLVKEPHFFLQHDTRGMDPARLRDLVEREYLDRYYAQCERGRDTGLDGSVSYLYAPEHLIPALLEKRAVESCDPATEDLFYRTYTRNPDNTVTTGPTTKVLAGDLTSIAGGQKTFTIGSATGASNIDAVQLFMGSGTVKVPVIDFFVTQQFAGQPTEMNFTATLSDNDSDTNSDTFKVAVT